MEHIIQIAISVEDKEIVDRVKKTAEKQIIETLTKEVEEVILKKHGGFGGRDYETLREMAQEKIGEILEENKGLIILEASKMLADKLARSKAGKEILNELKGEG